MVSTKPSQTLSPQSGSPTTPPKPVSAYMAEIGKKGGAKKTKKKTQAARANGKRGGRPKKQVSKVLGV